MKATWSIGTSKSDPMPDWFPRMPSVFRSACRVCGLLQPVAPWGDDGWTVPSFEICDCCGCEFGLDDVHQVTVFQRRQEWCERAVDWFNPAARPERWCLNDQLALIPPPYRAGFRVHDMNDCRRIVEEHGSDAIFTMLIYPKTIGTLLENEPWAGQFVVYRADLFPETVEALINLNDPLVIKVLQSRPEMNWDSELRAILRSHLEVTE